MKISDGLVGAKQGGNVINADLTPLQCCGCGAVRCGYCGAAIAELARPTTIGAVPEIVGGAGP